MNRLAKWDDLRIVLAVLETGSLSRAARRLGRSHATLHRRVGEIERELGARLFDRHRAGYSPTAAGEAVAEAARRVEASVHDLERRVAGEDLRPSGTVRVTTTDSLLFGALGRLFAGFRAAHPEIALEVAVSNDVFNLSRREADIAIRPALHPPETLVGRRISRIEQAVYVRRAHADAAETWIGPDERMAYRALERWMAAEGHDAACAVRLDTVLGMYAAARAGLGAAVLPCYLGEGDDDLVRFGTPIETLATDLWLLTHDDLRRTARIRAFMDFVGDPLAERNPNQNPNM